KGDAVANLPGVTYTMGNFTPRMNSSGEVALFTQLGGTSTGSNDFGIAVGTPGNVQVVVRKGDLAIGAAGTTQTPTIGSVATANPAINNVGGIAYRTSLSNAISGGSDAAWYKPAGQAPQLILQTGTAAPGAPGTTFGGFHDQSPNVNDHGFAVMRMD